MAAFEQSLGNMTIRLKSLTLTAEQKVKPAASANTNCMNPTRCLCLNLVSAQDSELNDLRKTIELLKKQNAVAQAAINGVINTPELVPTGDRTGTGTLQSPGVSGEQALGTEEVVFFSESPLSWDERQSAAAAAEPAA